MIILIFITMSCDMTLNRLAPYINMTINSLSRSDRRSEICRLNDRQKKYIKYIEEFEDIDDKLLAFLHYIEKLYEKGTDGSFTLMNGFINAVGSDREIVKVMVNYRGHLFKWVDETLQKDIEIILIALRSDRYIFRFLDKEVLENVKYMRKIIAICPCMYESLCSNIRGDEIVTRIAIGKNSNNLRHASEKIRNNREIVLNAVKDNFRVYMDASATLQDDDEIAEIAISGDSYNYNYISKRLKNDQMFINKMLAYCPDLWHNIPESLKTNDARYAYENHIDRNIAIDMEDFLAETQ